MCVLWIWTGYAMHMNSIPNIIGSVGIKRFNETKKRSIFLLKCFVIVLLNGMRFISIHKVNKYSHVNTDCGLRLFFYHGTEKSEEKNRIGSENKHIYVIVNNERNKNKVDFANANEETLLKTSFQYDSHSLLPGVEYLYSFHSNVYLSWNIQWVLDVTPKFGQRFCLEKGQRFRVKKIYSLKTLFLLLFVFVHFFCFFLLTMNSASHVNIF